MFANDLSFDIIPMIIDLFLHLGYRALIQIALALLSFMRPRLLSMTQDEIMVLMSSAQTRERLFQRMDSSQLLTDASKFQISSGVMKQLSDLFVLGHMLQEQKHAKYRFLNVFQRMTLDGSNQLHLLSMTPEDVDDYRDAEVTQIHNLYSQVKN